jgi:glycosyltransferase involved in cell wall biosynthesis
MIIKMILTNRFDPDPRVYKEAKTLIENGHDVEILCWDREGKYIEKQYEKMDGIKIRRFFPKGQYGGGYKQILGYLKFIKEVKKYLNSNEVDAIHCHDFDGLCVGYIIKKNNKNIKLIYDEHDLFYLYFKHREGIINKLLYKIIIFMEEKLLRKVDNHIVVTLNMKKIYNNKSNISIINNAPLKNTFLNINKLERKNIIIGFIGTVRYYEELRILIDVAKDFENISIFIAGKGLKLNKLKDYVSGKGYTNVEFYGEYKLEKLGELYSKIDITYLIYPTIDSLVSLPNKFFESIITETPIIANEESEYGQIVKEEGLGWVIDFDDLENGIRKILEEINKNPHVLNYYRNNMRKVKNKYYWESNEEKLCEIYK